MLQVELKYSNAGSEQLFYMEKCLVHWSSFPGHCDLWDLRTRNFFPNVLIIRKNYSFLSSCSEPHLQGIDVNTVCNWESILSAPVERVHLSEAGNELMEQEKSCPGCVSWFPSGVITASRAEAPFVSPLSQSSPLVSSWILNLVYLA